MTERITILIANYNNMKYLEECFFSLHKQTTQYFDIIVCDDNSRDRSYGFLKGIVGSYGKRMKIIMNKENIGYTRCLIKLIDAAETDIVGILDPDDKLEPSAIQSVLGAYDILNKEIGFIYTNFWYCDESMERKRIGYCKKIPRGKTNVDCDCVSHFKTFRKSYYEKTNGLDENMKYGQDKDLVYKMEEVCKLFFINKPLYLLRRHEHAVHSNKENVLLARKLVEQAKNNALRRRHDARRIKS